MRKNRMASVFFGVWERKNTMQNHRCQRREKVLLIDLDGQGHASLLCGVRNVNQLRETTASLLNRIIRGERLPEAESFLLRHKGVDLIPSNSQLFALERNLANADFRETKLRELTEQFREAYEYILIDCMPNGHR